MDAKDKRRLEQMHDREDARATFNSKRAERDALAAAGDRKGAWTAHFEADQAIKDYQKRRRS